jgi:hypothetical protein
MLYIILLLILAVLLFGSSAVLGAIGWVFGIVAGIIALVLIKDRFGLDPEVVIFGGIAGLAALFGLLMLILKLIEPWEMKRIEQKMAEDDKALKAKLARMSPAELKKFAAEQKAIIERHKAAAGK